MAESQSSNFHNIKESNFTQVVGSFVPVFAPIFSFPMFFSSDKLVIIHPQELLSMVGFHTCVAPRMAALHAC